jgi:hypothetical protein
MTENDVKPQQPIGFWGRLMLALEDVQETYAERQDKRISRLEAEVRRLQAKSEAKAL